MTEAEVSLSVAQYFIKHGLVDSDMTIAIDGAQVRSGSCEIFPIEDYLSKNGFVKVEGEPDKWQGIYQIDGYDKYINITSKPGIGDVTAHLADGRELYVECKKGKTNKSSQEYPLMREAIGQIMTSKLMNNTLPMVAVPYSEKTYSLADEWSKLDQIKQIGIRFMLVKTDGNAEFVGK